MKWDKFKQNFTKYLDKALDTVTKKKEMDDLGKELVDQITKRTRLGKGVTGGKASKFKPLTESTKKSRGYKNKRGKLSGKTSPAKSNLTESGDMIDSLHHKAKDKSLKIDVDPKERDKVKYNADNDREFLHLTKKQIKKIEKEMEDKLVKELTKLLK